MGIQSSRQSYKLNMLRLLILLPLMVTAHPSQHGGDHHGDGHDDQCVDISRYSEVQYNITIAPICTYRASRVCNKQIGTACVSIPHQDCQVIGYSKCSSDVFTGNFNDDSVDSLSFTTKKCFQDGFKTLNENNKVPVCREVTKEVCDSKWVLNAAGEKVWAGNSNCQLKTVEECELVENDNPTQVPVWKCEDDVVINYNVPVIRQVSVDYYATKCRAAAYSQCTTRQETQCVEVEYEECTDIVEPTCFGCATQGAANCGMEFRTPYQTYDHRLKCIV